MMLDNIKENRILKDKETILKDSQIVNTGKIKVGTADSRKTISLK